MNIEMVNPFRSHSSNAVNGMCMYERQQKLRMQKASGTGNKGGITTYWAPETDNKTITRRK